MVNTANPNRIFKTLQLIYGALMAGILVLSAIIFTLIEEPIYHLDFTNMFTIVVPILAASSLFFSDYLYKSMISRISTDSTLNAKLIQYQTATIVKGAWLEAPAMFAVVASFLSTNITFLLIALFIVAIMYLKFPKKEKFKEEVKLSFQEKSEFDRL